MVNHRGYKTVCSIIYELEKIQYGGISKYEVMYACATTVLQLLALQSESKVFLFFFWPTYIRCTYLHYNTEKCTYKLKENREIFFMCFTN